MTALLDSRLIAATAGLLIFGLAGQATAGSGPVLPDVCGFGVARDVGGLLKFFLDADQDGAADASFVFGSAGEEFLVGDWDGDGLDNVAVRRDISGFGKFFFRNTNASGPAAAANAFVLGETSATAVVGDWDGDGDDNVAVRRNVGGTGKFFFDTNGDRNVEASFVFGSATEAVVAGDWDGDGDDNVGVVREISGGLRWFLADDTGGVATNFAFGAVGDTPIVGDWDNDGDDDPGVIRSVGGVLRFFLDTNRDTAVEIDFSFGSAATDQPLACQFSGDDMKDEVGIARSESSTGRKRFITTSGLDGLQTLRVAFGNQTDSPLVGIFAAGGGGGAQ